MAQQTLAARLVVVLQRQFHVHAGERIGVAVSGGADSVALLLLLLELRERLGAVLSVAHFNHKLRGRASDADEKFVAKLAAKFGLAFHVERADIAAQAKREKANLEDAARRARYAFFSRLVDGGHMQRVAVAHTADDQAETVLAHILRGTGLAGLGGIHPVGHPAIRPLLNFRRAELRNYLRAKRQTWREDLTNKDVTRLRARIRTKLLPFLEKQFQPAVVQHLTSLAELAREDEAFLNLFAERRLIPDLTEAHLNPYAADPNLRCLRITAADLVDSARTHSAIARRMVRLIVKKMSRGSGQVGAEHVGAVLEFAAGGENGKELQLPGGLEVRREGNDLLFLSRTLSDKKHAAAKLAPSEFEYKIDLKDGETILRVPQLGCAFRLRVIDWPAKRGETNSIGAVLDRDRLEFPLLLRNWRPGDKLHPLGRQKARKLKRLFQEKRISRWARDGWPVLTSGGVVVWAHRFPVAAGFAANKETREGILIAEETY